MEIKKSVFVRIAGESVYSKHIEINPLKLKNIMKFPKEVFADIDGIRISMLREDYETLMESSEE
jgi:hypothetical protein